MDINLKKKEVLKMSQEESRAKAKYYEALADRIKLENSQAVSKRVAEEYAGLREISRIFGDYPIADNVHHREIIRKTNERK